MPTNLFSDRQYISGCLGHVGCGGIYRGRNYKALRSFWKVKDTLITLTAVMVSQAYAYVSTHQPVYFKYVQLIVC